MLHEPDETDRIAAGSRQRHNQHIGRGADHRGVAAEVCSQRQRPPEGGRGLGRILLGDFGYDLDHSGSEGYVVHNGRSETSEPYHHEGQIALIASSYVHHPYLGAFDKRSIGPILQLNLGEDTLY